MPTRYLLHAAAAAAICATFASYLALRAWPFHPAALLAGWVYGIAFPTLAVIRLPLFRDYLRRGAPNELAEAHARDAANDKAAMALASLLSGATLAALWMALRLGAATDAAVCAALASGVMTRYYLDRR